MIRTSLAVLPRRSTVFAAKAIIFTGVALVTGLVTTFAAFFLGQSLMSGKHINATLGQPNVLRAVFAARCSSPSAGRRRILGHYRVGSRGPDHVLGVGRLCRAGGVRAVALAGGLVWFFRHDA
jgi:hypothetical protein